MLGRGLLPSDAADGQEPQPVTVISYKFWRTHFFADPGVIGKTLQLNHKSYLIVGVARPASSGTCRCLLASEIIQDPNLTFVVNLRLRPGRLSCRRKRGVAARDWNNLLEKRPKRFPEHIRVQVEGLNEWVARSISEPCICSLAQWVLLLAIGCGNASILLLARGAAREHEFAVRAAVGANRLSNRSPASDRISVLPGFDRGLLLASRCPTESWAVSVVLLPRYAFASRGVIHINLPVSCSA
jgi:hypothetical protein